MSLVTIYDENVEWVFSSLSGSYHPADMSNPHTGVIDLVYNNNVGGSRNVGSFAAPSSVNSSLMSQLSLWLLPSNWAAGRTVILNWADSGGNQVGNTVTIQNGTFGFNTGSAVYQNIVIPMSQFAIPSGTQVGQLVISSSSGIFVYLLDTVVLTLLNVNCDPSTLASSAICFEQCIPDPAQVRSYLLCQYLTACRAPLAPTGLSLAAGANNPGSTTITVQWTQPLQIGGPNITGYLVKWGTASGNYNVGSAVVPASPLSYTITGLNPATTYFIVVDALATSCPSSNSNEFSTTTTGGLNGLLNGLVHYWNMDSFNANTVADIIDAVNPSGTNAGADMSLTNNGILNNCITCTGAAGVNQIFTAGPTATDLIVKTVPSAQSITYQCWFWLASVQPAGNPIFVAAFSGAAAGQYMVMFAPAATNIPLFRYYNNAGVNVDLNWTGAVTRQAWHHFIGGYDASVGETFMQIDNGTRIFSAAFTPRGNSNAFDWCFFNGTSINNEMAGRLDEIGVWQRALTATDVSTLFNGGNALSESQFTN